MGSKNASFFPRLLFYVGRNDVCLSTNEYVQKRILAKAVIAYCNTKYVNVARITLNEM